MAYNDSPRPNWVPIVILVIAILGGIFLLQQTVLRGDSADSSNSNSSSSSTSSIAVASVSSSSVSKASSSSLSSSSSSSVEPVDDTMPDASSSSSSSESSSSSSSSEATTSTLSSDQIKATLKSTDGNQYNFEIQECGLPEAKICKQGTKMNLILSSKISKGLSVGTMYLITADFEEVPGGINFKVIQTIKAV